MSISHLKIATYGRWSSRKTFQVGSLIDRFGVDKVFVVSIDKGLGPVQSKVKHYVEVNSLDDLRKAYQQAVEFIKKNGDDCWVVLDGMSRAMNFISDSALGAADEAAEQMAQGVPVQGLRTEIRPFARFVSSSYQVDTMRIYGTIGVDSKNLLGAWLRLDCNLYSTYLEDMTSNGRERVPPYVPDVPGQVGLKAVMSTYDFVIRLTIKGSDCVAQMDPGSSLYMSRTREDQTLSGPLPKEIVGFNLADFVTLVRGGAN